MRSQTSSNSPSLTSLLPHSGSSVQVVLTCGKCNFPLTQVGWSVGQSVMMITGRTVTLPCSYRSAFYYYKNGSGRVGGGCGGGNGPMKHSFKPWVANTSGGGGGERGGAARSATRGQSRGGRGGSRGGAKTRAKKKPFV